eukprot:CAMPEP_0173415716 /NCGR_PEP_ID=MMETSP1356-20130122/85012_1 /TAXON_ID=77927 ORGANISM="Hemiselmis virescens, Strain PCC157" /NCGR_SAMPLE_ID=MMETSP1356 /ASSEMBLY_ACC=CAM_ASM_000847 /LENGTH=73 /DNA_ID=CAMNT_0014377987 /DNA_START=450 /DNA_END=671 /DNA_ORIENTATION=-
MGTISLVQGSTKVYVSVGASRGRVGAGKRLCPLYHGPQLFGGLGDKCDVVREQKASRVGSASNWGDPKLGVRA